MEFRSEFLIWWQNPIQIFWDCALEWKTRALRKRKTFKLIGDPVLQLTGSVGGASHLCRGGHGFESRWSPDTFPASSFQLLKLENLLRWSLFTFIYNRSAIWISYIPVVHIIEKSPISFACVFHCPLLPQWKVTTTFPCEKYFYFPFHPQIRGPGWGVQMSVFS